MKTRNGFVSNSSSSSFIVFGKCIDVAEAMLSINLRERLDPDNASEYDPTDIDRYLESYKKEKMMLDSIRSNPILTKRIDSGELGISFSVVAGETQLVKCDDTTCCCDTCNNVSWWNHLIIHESREEGDHTVDNGQLLISLRDGIIYSRIPYSGLRAACKNCNSTWGTILSEDKKPLCQGCRTPLPVTS